MKHFDNKRPEFTPYGFTCEQWKPEPMHRPDRHNEIELNLLDGGSLTYLMWGHRSSVQGGCLAAFWAAVPHQIVEFQGVGWYYVVTVPLAWVLNWNLPEDLVHQLLNGEIVQEQSNDRASSDAALMNQWSEDLEFGHENRQEIILLELKARLLRLALGAETGTSQKSRRGPYTTKRGPSTTRKHVASKAEKMAQFIAENYRNPVSVAEVAKVVGLHPDYAATLFRKTFGTTLNRFLLDHRIQHAQRMLVTSDEKIIVVAFESGFNSLSRFNAAFKELCGSTPRQFRRTHRL